MEFISTEQCEKYKGILNQIDGEYKQYEELKKNIENENQELAAIQISNRNLLKDQIFRVVVKVYDSIFDCFFIYQDIVSQPELATLQTFSNSKFYAIELTISKTVLQKLKKQKFLLHMNVANSLWSLHKTISAYQKESFFVVIVPFKASTQPSEVITSIYTKYNSIWHALYTSTIILNSSYLFSTRVKESYYKDSVVKIAHQYNPELTERLKSQSADYKFKCKCTTEHFFNSLIKNCYNRFDLDTFVVFANTDSPVLTSTFFCNSNDEKTVIKLDKTKNVLTINSYLYDLIYLKKYFIKEMKCQDACIDKLWLVALKNLKQYIRAEFGKSTILWSDLWILYQELRELIYDLSV
ncbi:hypothetical protein FQR65_LT11121 [Abscondita terminalis]|nr:hypothetical protein FQR65_LT11121 [Abscondita terminalis]